MAQNDILARAPARADDPSKDGLAFTGTVDVTVDPPSRGLYIGADGDVTVDMLGYDGAAGATNLTFAGAKAGSILPICVIKIYDTGTTASGVILR